MEGKADQARVVAFLEGGGLGEPVERVDTHGAHVFLGRERAWKMKRAVRFSFMDLSTPEERERTVRAELELNRRTAPELYRRVLTLGQLSRMLDRADPEVTGWALVGSLRDRFLVAEPTDDVADP